MNGTPEAPAPRSPPRVSVISIFYNEERYIREAVESVLSQDFEDFELLLVDDGSSDRSTRIAEELASAYPGKVRYLDHPHHENRGMSASRNLGLKEARGDLIAFIDADDRWRQSKLGEQVVLLQSMPDVDAVGGSVNYWSSHRGGKDRLVRTGHIQDRAIAPVEATLNFYPLGRAHAPSMSDLMFRRAAIFRVGGFEERFKGAYEDQAFLAKFYLESTLYLTTRTWSDYRLHDASCMATVHSSGAYGEARRAFLLWFEQYLAAGPHRDRAAIRRRLAKALKSCPAEEGPLVRADLRKTLRNSTPDVVLSIVRSGKSALRRLRPMLAPGPAILMYHRIAEEDFDPWCLAVSPEHFADHLSFIARDRTPLAMSTFAELHREGRLPRNAIAVTFDDGYACGAEVAARLLERFQVPATIFLPAELIDSGRELWWDDLERIVMNRELSVLRLDEEEIALGETDPDDGRWPAGEAPWTARQHAYRRIWSILYRRTPERLEEGMKVLREQAQVPDAPRDTHRLLTAKEVGTMRSDLIEFGSHAMRHPSLPRLSSAEKKREIGESVARLAEYSGKRPMTFAYPYGDFDRESERIVEDAGFLGACKAEGWFVTRRTNRFALPRIFVGDWDAGRLARQLGRP